jgi:hypothetical protein
MPDIMIRCPSLGKAVSTGLSTETVVLDSLSGLTIPLRCPAYKKVHKWHRRDAWEDDNRTLRPRQTSEQARGGGQVKDSRREMIRGQPVRTP